MPFSTRFPSLPRVLVASMSLLLAVVLGTTYAAAQSSEPVSQGALGTSGIDTAEPVAPGTTVTLSGSGYAPGSTVEIFIESDPILLATVTADATGSFSVEVAIPSAGLAAGQHTLKAVGADATGGLRVLTQPVEVAGDTATAGSLPRTGTDPLVLVLVGVGLLGAGGAALLVRRHRVT